MGMPVFVFPGQGSQQQGMGADLLSQDGRYRRLIADANRLSGIDVAEGLRSPADDANGSAVESPLSTVATQLSVFALSVSLGRRLLEGGLLPQAVAGHSLGEFSALVVGGWLDVDAGLELVAERSAVMERCCVDHDGAMLAVVGLSQERLDDSLRGTDAVLANRNSPKQVVISGRRAAIAEVAERAEAAGAKRVVELPVAGAFHSPLMTGAEAALQEHVHGLPITKGAIPLISSVTGNFVDDVAAYRDDLAGQITKPVQWADVMTTIAETAADDPRRVVEVGPGAVLRGLFRQVDRKWPVSVCGSLDDCTGLLPDRPADLIAAAA